MFRCFIEHRLCIRPKSWLGPGLRFCIAIVKWWEQAPHVTNQPRGPPQGRSVPCGAPSRTGAPQRRHGPALLHRPQQGHVAHDMARAFLPNLNVDRGDASCPRSGSVNLLDCAAARTPHARVPRAAGAGCLCAATRSCRLFEGVLQSMVRSMFFLFPYTSGDTRVARV